MLAVRDANYSQEFWSGFLLDQLNHPHCAKFCVLGGATWARHCGRTLRRMAAAAPEGRYGRDQTPASHRKRVDACHTPIFLITSAGVSTRPAPCHPGAPAGPS